VTVLEGESLINDATALIAFRFARGFRTRPGKEIVDDGLALPPDEHADERSCDDQRFLREAQRDALIALRREGAIGDDTIWRIERDLDLEDARLDFER
jgi:hypothetical protein